MNEIMNVDKPIKLMDTLNKKVNAEAVAKVNENLPHLVEKTRYFDRSNSQTTLTMMSLTMLNGQSPFRVARQILAEVESRKTALSETQVSYAELIRDIEDLEGKSDIVSVAKYSSKVIAKSDLEGKINGAIKDIATLANAYQALVEKHSMQSWNEEDFENEEKKHHTRRAFELLYRNLIEIGRAKTSTIEYLTQFGIHVQVALKEVQGYITFVEKQIESGIYPDASSLEDFLDEMAEKYKHCADIASDRLFGSGHLIDSRYMDA